MSVLTTAVAGVVFGIALAAPPGPMNAIIAEESVLRGWSAGFRAGLGAMTADIVFFVLALFGAVSAVERFPTLRGVMVAIGGVLMLYFAYGAARSATETFRATAGSDETGKGFQKAFVLALTNPYQIIFWLTIGVGLLEPGRLDVLAPLPALPGVGDLAGAFVVSTGSPTLIVGFFSGIVVWITGFPATLVGVGERVDSFAPIVAGGSAIALAFFGVIFLADAAGTLL
ncbi:LysE family translocator [Halalkalirubrum salinum]|uniref:LysE family translocator n=1 Tax=Halalkalirubrum salinum TaxID=2563889 RepID=UPI0010FBA527|nr:LysE family transporter [Halalkalirubrum salinum]